MSSCHLPPQQASVYQVDGTNAGHTASISHPDVTCRPSTRSSPSPPSTRSLSPPSRSNFWRQQDTRDCWGTGMGAIKLKIPSRPELRFSCQPYSRTIPWPRPHDTRRRTTELTNQLPQGHRPLTPDDITSALKRRMYTVRVQVSPVRAARARRTASDVQDRPPFMHRRWCLGLTAAPGG